MTETQMLDVQAAARLISQLKAVARRALPLEVPMSKAGVISFCGKVPLLGTSLRRIARRYPEGSVVTVAAGHLAGCKWKRSHRYLSGYWLGHYELSIQDCLVRELSPGDVVYDIGANTGFFTLLASKCVGPEGRVYAFEPLPENVRSLGWQLQLNNVTNCTIVEAAVADRTGCVELAEGKDTNTAHLRAVRPHRSGGAVMSVKAIALDDFTRDRPKPDFIKMDVEGAEILALNGAAELLRARPPRMLIECHGEPLKRDACDLLQTCGYQVRLPDAGEADAETQGRHLLCVPDDLRA